MFFRIIFLIVAFLFISITTASASTYTEEVSSLRKVLRIDRTIRTSTGDVLREQRNRARLLMTTSTRIGNIWDTWNLVPTTDHTLDYTLTLQKYRLSCEIAAMKAIYTALGYKKTEDQIILTLPLHNKPYNTIDGTWGDPDLEFVWLIDGSQSKKTWYGIYEPAIAKYFHDELSADIPALRTEAWNEFTRPKGYTDATHLTHLLGSLDAGKHVIIWWDWCTNPLYEDGILGRDKKTIARLFPISGKNTCKNWHINRDFTWKTPEWKEIIAFNGDHVFVLLGYIGKKERPSHIIVWDTDTGRHIYPTSEWMRKWDHIENRSLVVSN